MPDFESMNETDVREIIVRPLLTRLGYEHGSENTIRTEQVFRYAKAFLGRKKPGKDPELAGRADYILEVASVGRWVVEVKGPNEELGKDVVEQAHTYAAHPEVAAIFFLVTNGRKFCLYRTSYLEAPLMSWVFEETEDVFLALFNLVGPAAVRRKMALLQPDTGKPLGLGLSSRVQIIGGWIQYEDHRTNHPFLENGVAGINGLRLPVTGSWVGRAEDGRLQAKLNTAKAMPMAGELSELLEITDGYDFFCNDNLISNIQDKPSIFQNIIHSEIPIGTEMRVPGIGAMHAPFGF